MGIKVSLRYKHISKNRQALYLDYFPAVTDIHTGKETRRLFLNKYMYNQFEYETVVVKDKNGNDRTKIQIVKDKKGRDVKVKLTLEQQKHNDQVIKLAESTRYIRENEIAKPEIYNSFELGQIRLTDLGEQDFIAYFKKIAEKRVGSNREIWLISIKYFEAFTNGKLKFSDLNKKLCNDYRDYLKSAISIHKKESTPLSINTTVSYFNKLKATLRQAYDDGLILTDLNRQVNTIKPEKSIRECLMLEELNSLVNTTCKDSTLKKAAIFSSLTGLRHSDIKKLIWGEIQFSKDHGYSIRFRQQKTREDEALPISEQAYQLLGHPGTPQGKVFPDLEYSAYKNQILDDWVKAAGITKHIRFHSFRHTNATLLIDKGIDIYTVSKMLGHKSVKTTQIYAQVLDRAKREASNKIKLDI